jgi:hypothetical protein
MSQFVDHPRIPKFNRILDVTFFPGSWNRLEYNISSPNWHNIVTPQPPRSLKQSIYQVRMLPKTRLQLTPAHDARSVNLSCSRLRAICP